MGHFQSSQPVLTPPQRRLVWAMQEHPLASARELARISRFAIGRTQYLLRQLEERHHLIVRPFINFLATGIQYIAIYATFRWTHKEQREAVRTFMKAAPEVGWCGTFVGDFELAFMLCCEHLAEIPRFLDRLRRETGVQVIERILSPRIRFLLFKRKYLSTDSVAKVTLTTEYPLEPVVLDTLDRQLLKALAEERYSSVREVARLIGAPVSTVDRRIRDLRRNSIIVGDYVDLPAAAIGVLPYRILLKTRGLDNEPRKRLIEFCRGHRWITFVIETLGPYDLEIGLELEAPELIMEISAELTDQFGAYIHSTHTLLESEVIKWSMFPGVTGRRRA